MTGASAGRGRSVQTMVGTSSRSVPKTVRTAISSEVMMPSTRSGKSRIAANECEAPAAVVAPGRELEHREQGQEQVAEDHEEDRDPRAQLATGIAGAGRRPSAAPEGAALDRRRRRRRPRARSPDPPRGAALDQRVGGHHQRDDDDHPERQGLADVLLAEDDLALELVGDLERDDRAPWLMRAAAVA